MLVCSGSFDRYSEHKRNNPTCDPWDSKESEKIMFPFPLLLVLDILVRNENIISKEHKTKKCLK